MSPVTYNLKYKTFDQLLTDVMIDFKNYSLSNMIEPQTLIKVAKKVNKDLGLRLLQTKETVLELNQGRCKLPDDFNILNLALVCGSYTVTQIPPQGTHIEEVNCTDKVLKYTPAPDIVSSCDALPEPCTPTLVLSVPDSCCLNKCGNEFSLIQVIKSTTRTYDFMYPLKLKKSSYIHSSCPNFNMQTENEAWIKDGWLYTSFDTGTIYLNYEGALEDEEGNLLVPDHDSLNEYYEYALKDRLLENLYFNGEEVLQKLQLAQLKLKEARKIAKTIVNTPNFNEIRETIEMNRRVMYSRFYKMFQS